MIELVAIVLALLVGFGVGFYFGGIRVGHTVGDEFREALRAEMAAGRLSKDEALAMVDRASARVKAL